MGAAVTQAGPVAAGKGGLPCSEAEGLLGWGLPGIQQRGQAALLVPGLPFAVLRFWVSCCTRAITACLLVGRRRFVTKCRCRQKQLGGMADASQEGEDAGVSTSSADLPFCFPALFSSSPLQEVSAGKALLTLQTQPFTLQEAEAQLEIFTGPKIMGCKEFGGLPQAGVCGSVTLCSYCLRKAVPYLLQLRDP